MCLFSCFALLLIVLKHPQLQCSFPLFSSCANIRSKHLSLNRILNTECSLQVSRWITGMAVALVNCYYITCLNGLDRFAHQTVFTDVYFSSPSLYSDCGFSNNSSNVKCLWFWQIFWLSFCLGNRTKHFGSRFGCQSTVSSIHYQSLYSYICCISSF